MGIITPILVSATLVFSGIALTSSPTHGQGTDTQVAPSVESEWLRGIGSVVSAVAGPGFAVWYAYHMTTKRLPEVEKGHREVLEKLSDEHAETVKRLIDDFRGDVKAMWDTKRQDDALLRETLKGLKQ